VIFSYVLKPRQGCYGLTWGDKATMAKLKILYGESNPELLSAQGAVLEKAGYRVHPALGRKAVEQAVKQESFDLVVLGPTLSRDDRHHLPYMVKKAQAETRVLVMHTDGSRHPYVDSNMDTGISIEQLLEKISSLYQHAKAAAAR
jgi:DNA-binding NtrC family response regulator